MAQDLKNSKLAIFRPNLDYCIALEVVRPTRKKAGRKATTPPLAESEASPSTTN